MAGRVIANRIDESTCSTASCDKSEKPRADTRLGDIVALYDHAEGGCGSSGDPAVALAQMDNVRQRRVCGMRTLGLKAQSTGRKAEIIATLRESVLRTQQVPDRLGGTRH